MTHYPDHPITQGMRGMSVFPLVRSLAEIVPAPAGVTVRQVLETDQESWAETDFSALDKTGRASSTKGWTPATVTIGLAAGNVNSRPGDAADADKKVSRLVAIGDSEFAANAYFGTQFNGDIFLNCVNWLSVDENLISIRPKNPPPDKRVMLTAAHEKMMFYFSVVLLPLIPLVIGVVVRVIRRRKR